MDTIITTAVLVAIAYVLSRSSYKCGYADAKNKYQKKQCPIQTKVVCSVGTCETTVDHCDECKRTSEPKMNC